VVLERLLEGAMRIEFPAGTSVYLEWERPACGVVVSGLIRMFMTAPDGRQVTVRYARAGELVGVPSVIGHGAPVSTQILIASSGLMFNTEAMRALGQTDARVGWLLAEEATRRVFGVLEALAGHTFGTVRQRVAWHLLELAARQQHDDQLVARVTQQDLADAVASVRQVVARTLRDLRTAGLVETTSSGIRVLDPDGLHDQAWRGRTSQ
jgi:CRP/FNR family transcriptional regulator